MKCFLEFEADGGLTNKSVFSQDSFRITECSRDNDEAVYQKVDKGKSFKFSFSTTGFFRLGSTWRLSLCSSRLNDSISAWGSDSNLILLFLSACSKL